MSTELNVDKYVERLKSVSFSELQNIEIHGSVIELLSRLQCLALLKDQSEDQVDTGLFESQVVIDRAWEFLNTGHWTDVPDTWRRVYAFGCFFRIVFLHLKGGSLPEIIKVSDKGLLMGIPVMDNVLASIATEAQKLLCVTDLQISVGEESSAVALTPSSEPLTKRLKTTSKGKGVARHATPSIQWFLNNVLNREEPVIFTDCVQSWPAFSQRRWSVDYLRRIAGNRTVPVEIGSKYTDDSWSQKLLTINDFIAKYIEGSGGPVGYLAQHRLFDQIPELRSDIVIPDYCLFGESEPEDVQINAWIGPEGTVSPLHFDPENNFLVQVVGQKYVRLYSQGDSECLYPYEGMLSNTSQVDLLNPDYSAFPLFADCPFWECVLEEGEMLFIPQKMWHFVTSLSRSFSVSFWWH